MKKKFLTVSLAAALLAGSVFGVSAAGVKDLLSTDYYANKYNDLKEAYGEDKDAYIAHFLTSGAKEGRIMNPILDVAEYRKAYADLDAAFGDDWDAYVNHYLTTGVKEGRMTGVLFDLVDYANKNADLKAAFGEDYAALAYQYVTAGINENRPGGKIEKKENKVESSSSNSGSSDNSGNSNNSGDNGNTNNTTPAPADPTPVPPTTEEVVDSHEHTKGTLLSTLHATCTEEGYVEWKCDKPVMVNKYDANGNWIGTEQKVVNGVKLTCDHVWREKLGYGHSPAEADENLYVVHPTCTSKGLMKYTCTNCGKQITEELDQLVHDYVVTNVKTVASKDCTEAGRGTETTTNTCKNCGISYDDVKKLPALNHKVGGFPNVIEAATCTKVGTSMGHCDVCGEKEYNIIPIIPHALVQRTVYADSYITNDQALTHNVWTIEYCKDCKVIETATRLTTGDVCVDGNGDGACDTCNLRMDRVVTNKVMEYKKGDKYIGDVQ